MKSYKTNNEITLLESILIRLDTKLYDETGITPEKKRQYIEFTYNIVASRVIIIGCRKYNRLGITTNKDAVRIEIIADDTRQSI